MLAFSSVLTGAAPAIQRRENQSKRASSLRRDSSTPPRYVSVWPERPSTSMGRAGSTCRRRGARGPAATSRRENARGRVARTPADESRGRRRGAARDSYHSRSIAASSCGLLGEGLIGTSRRARPADDSRRGAVARARPMPPPRRRRGRAMHVAASPRPPPLVGRAPYLEGGRARRGPATATIFSRMYLRCCLRETRAAATDRWVEPPRGGQAP